MSYVNKEELLEALNVFNDYEHGNKHFLFGIETAKELIEQAVTYELPNSAFYKSPTPASHEPVEAGSVEDWMTYAKSLEREIYELTRIVCERYGRTSAQ